MCVFARSVCPITLVFAADVDGQIARHAEDPRAHVLDLGSVASRREQSKERFLCDLFGQPVLASQCAQIAEQRVAELVEPTLDFLAEIARAWV
jgi:hypothetical protein